MTLRKNGVAIETLRTQILYTLLRDLVATYKKEPTNTEKIEYIKHHIMIVSGKSEKNYNESKKTIKNDQSINLKTIMI
jgi:hypothetical protein